MRGALLRGMNDQLSPSDLATIESLFKPSSDAPDTLRRTALMALAHDGTERALQCLERIKPMIYEADLRAWFQLALEECSYFCISARLDPILERLGDLKELAPATGTEEALEQEYQRLDEELCARGFCVDFSEKVDPGRQVAVLRAFLGAIGELRHQGEGQLHIDTWYGDDSYSDVFDGGWSVTPLAVGQA